MTLPKKFNITFRAFSLVELVVVLTIFSIMTGIATFNFKGFSSKVAIENLAYDIGLSVASIQQQAASGISSTGVGAPVGVFQGIEFTYNTGAGPAKFMPEFKLFRDNDGDKQYGPTTDVLVDSVKIQYNEYIENITFDTVSTFDNSPKSPNANVTIMFRRPWLDAYFYDFQSGSSVLLTGENYMRITIAAQYGSSTIRKYIVISRSGQISIQ